MHFPIYAARMNDPPVAAVGAGNQGTSELSQALGLHLLGDAGNRAAGESKKEGILTVSGRASKE